MSHKQSPVKYSFNAQGQCIIENYNNAKPFSNFFPGIAGIWGIPMWAFYVNRGQCIASFGIESKDKAIMEFQPANKAYRQTSLQGFRTFIKVKKGAKTYYWEPFQDHILGTEFKKNQKMLMSAHDLTLVEVNETLGLKAKINYFTMPNEPFSALVRMVEVENLKKGNVSIEIIDGLPMIVPYGVADGLNKNISRTIEAWVKVRNLSNQAPYYQLNVEVSDNPEVKHIQQGNFFFSFAQKGKFVTLLNPIVEPEVVFGQDNDFTIPVNFLKNNFKVPLKQFTSNRTPSALSHTSFVLKGGEKGQFTSLFGYAKTEDQLQEIVSKIVNNSYISKKAKENKRLIEGIKNYALTNSSSVKFNLYSEHTFLDNILRGGLPVSVKAKDGHVSFNVYSRKHGDLERDYNFFYVSPTFYSQGNGNYRDVNQNRRNDVWFNAHVKSSHLVTFLNLSQADGYNPLIVKGTSFAVKDKGLLKDLIERCVSFDDQRLQLSEILEGSFLPGEILEFVLNQHIALNIDIKDFLGQLLEICEKREVADHGEGFWSDHWTYNLDLIESYLSVYPEDLEEILFKKKEFSFYQSDHYVLPRIERYVLTNRGVRQYESVIKLTAKESAHLNGDSLKTLNGEGVTFKTTLIVKLLCLIANKVATLDPSGIGVELESDKPNWYDALNGLPGLLGSAISETIEIRRFAQFLLGALRKASVAGDQKVFVFEELANFIEGLTNILSIEKDAFLYWNKSNDIKEHYRQCVRTGISGKEKQLSLSDIENFLEEVVLKTKDAQGKAYNNGFLPTYFYHEVTDYKILDKKRDEFIPFVKPLKFKRHDLPLFLEGYVHALRAEENVSEAANLYTQVRSSGLFDKKLKMYKVNADLSSQTEEIGRTRIFPRGWLENESVWLHMEYKFMLELIRSGLHSEFYDNFKNVMVPFLKPEVYGRSVLENSSFIASSAHEDEKLHGQGFVARLSGSTAEFLHMWLYMNIGQEPFGLDTKGNLTLSFRPILADWLFTTKASKISFMSDNVSKTVQLSSNTYAFILFEGTLVVYHNPNRKNTFGTNMAKVKKMHILLKGNEKPQVVQGAVFASEHAQAVRNRQVERIDIFLQ